MTQAIDIHEQQQQLYSVITAGEGFLGQEPTLEVMEAFHLWLAQREAVFDPYRQLDRTTLDPKLQQLLQQLYQLGEPLEVWLVEQSALVESEISETQQFKQSVQHYAFPEVPVETQTWES
jgi:hypothetical protein